MFFLDDFLAVTIQSRSIWPPTLTLWDFRLAKADVSLCVLSRAQEIYDSTLISAGKEPTLVTFDAENQWMELRHVTPGHFGHSFETKPSLQSRKGFYSRYGTRILSTNGSTFCAAVNHLRFLGNPFSVNQNSTAIASDITLYELNKDPQQTSLLTLKYAVHREVTIRGPKDSESQADQTLVAINDQFIATHGRSEKGQKQITVFSTSKETAE